MTLKSIIEEEMDVNSISQQIQNLKNGVQNLSKKINTNPDLAKAYGQDLQGISQLSDGVNQSFQQIVQQQLKAKQQQQLQQQKNKQNTPVGQNKIASQTAQTNVQNASGTVAPTQVANGTAQ